MSRLTKLLDDVLAGRTQLQDPLSFRLLREYAPDKTDDLKRLEQEALERQQPKPMTNQQFPSPIRLTRNEMEAMLSGQRPATIEEVEWLLVHGDQHNVQLSETEELELRNVAARLLANRHIADARTKNHNAEFIAKTIGTFTTEYGDLTRDEVENLESIRVRAVKAIHDCKDHRRERCACWKPTREELFDLRCKAGEGTPVSMAALAVWNSVEALARDRPQQPSSNDQTEGLPGIVYNWRYHKCPDYISTIKGENI